MSRSFGGTRACNRSPFTWRHRHRTTFSRDQASVEITLKQRVPPPPHLPTRNPMLDQPLSLPAMCEPLILEHHLADLRRRKPCTDRQQPLPPLNASRLTHNQTGKEGSGSKSVIYPTLGEALIPRDLLHGTTLFKRAEPALQIRSTCLELAQRVSSYWSD